MDPELFDLLVFTFVAALIADVSMVFGVIPFYFIRNMSGRVAAILGASAGGMMAAASLVQLVGEGMDRSPGLEVWEVGAGLALGAVFYAAAAKWVERNEDFDVMALRKSGGTKALMIVAAMTVHSLPEGVAIGVAFGSQEQGLGISVVSALAVHNIPEAIAITLALKAAGLSTTRCLFWAVFTSLPQPIAAPFAAWFVFLFEPFLAAGMGFAAGAMTFLVIDELVPESLEEASPTTVASAFTAGVVAMIVLGRLVEGGGPVVG